MGVGIRLKRVLREKKITIKELAEKAGVPVNTLYSITRRDSENVDPVLLEKIAVALDISPNDLRREGPYNKEDWLESINRKLSYIGCYVAAVDDPEHNYVGIETPKGFFTAHRLDLIELDRQTDEYLEFQIMRLKSNSDQRMTETLERAQRFAESNKGGSHGKKE